jgi:hypothetical protein
MKKSALSLAVPSAVVVLAVLAILGLGPAGRRPWSEGSRPISSRPSKSDGARKLTPLSPDLPLPSLPPNGLSWTPGAVIVQPWGRTQWDAVVHAAERAPWLAENFGFNTMIVLPPAAHNAISGPADRITEQEFERALAIYRANGFRIIIYTSVMHCGHAPVWQDGTLEKTHPDWSQRGPEGEPVRIYGHDWLCPSTGAAAFTLEYTADLVRRYRPDLVMLDNAEFYETASGVTCYCEACQAGFRRYVSRRFGETVGGAPMGSLRIPAEPGFLYDVWLGWRNRVWGEANELFRRELRKIDPDIVVMSNTQYLRDKPDLATDLIYDHEDALISESVGLTTDGMIDKLMLGRALAKGKPLWNYLGTFQEKDNTLLVSPDVVAMNISTAYACGARPWIVYYGFTEDVEANKPALEKMARVLVWHRSRESEAGRLAPYAPVLSLVSLNSRNYCPSKLVPDHLARLRRRGIASWLIEERTVEAGIPSTCRALMIEDAPCLSDRAVAAIADFVKAGGLLVAAPDTATGDELGRCRPASALWKSLGVAGSSSEPVAAAAPIKVGRGRVAIVSFRSAEDELAAWLKPYRFSIPEGAGISIVPYTDARGRFIVYVFSESPLGKDLKIAAPGNKHGEAIICSGSALPILRSF